MSGIHMRVVFWISRIRCAFLDAAAPAITKSVSGTGFWVIEEDKAASFVTNRHLVDPRYWSPMGARGL